MATNEFDQGYAEHLSKLAKEVGGKVTMTAGIWAVIHTPSGEIAFTSPSPKAVMGWLSGQKDTGKPIETPAPRRGRKPGTKSAKKSARKSARRSATKTKQEGTS